MAGWSGLFDGVHGDGHSLLVDRPPGTERLQNDMQNRGMYGFAKGYGGTVPATRRRGDYATNVATPGSEVNAMNVPGTATDGVSPPNRDIQVDNAYGMNRPLNDDATKAAEDAPTLAYGIDTVLKFTYPGDKSGQTGPGL